MLLREIDLDMPFVKNEGFIKNLILNEGMEKQAAIECYYDTNWKKKRMVFRNEMRCIAAMYMRILGRFETLETRKIIINCVQACKQELPITTVDGFSEVEVEVDLSGYFSLKNEQKKKFLLEKLHEGMLKTALHYHWQSERFNYVYLKMVEDQLDNVYIWTKKSSPSRKYQAEIHCRHDLDVFEISLTIISNGDSRVVKKEVLIQEVPNEFLFVPHLGRLSWVSESELCFFNRSGSRKIAVKF